MPFPIFIAAAIAAAFAGRGIKKGFDAKEDFSKADRINDRANSIATDATSKLKKSQKNTRNMISSLGATKINILATSINDFLNNFQLIKNVDLKETRGIDELKHFNPGESELLDLQTSAYEAKELAKGGLTGVGAGALMAYGAYSAVGLTTATASTGIAISGLSGVAATNATLAWLGGGALSAGGMGIAGGMAVLGGLVVGPALFVGGSIFASKARTALNDAHSNLDSANAYDARVDKIRTALYGISLRAEQLGSILVKLDTILKPQITKMREIIRNDGTDYSKYANEDRKDICMCVATALTIKKVIDTSLLTEDGELDKDCLDVIQEIGEQVGLEYECADKNDLNELENEGSINDYKKLGAIGLAMCLNNKLDSNMLSVLSNFYNKNNIVSVEDIQHECKNSIYQGQDFNFVAIKYLDPLNKQYLYKLDILAKEIVKLNGISILEDNFYMHTWLPYLKNRGCNIDKLLMGTREHELSTELE